MSNLDVNTRPDRARSAPCGVDRSLLKAEISFWQEMIRFRDVTMTDESLERMQQALALAQSKLNNSETVHPFLQTTENRASGNVTCIRSRKK
jgi:hypothetical protein